MKKIICYLLIITMLSCSCTDPSTKYQGPLMRGRIIEKESVIIGGYNYRIIQVDTVEFLCSPQGGMSKISK